MFRAGDMGVQDQVSMNVMAVPEHCGIGVAEQENGDAEHQDAVFSPFAMS